MSIEAPAENELFRLRKASSEDQKLIRQLVHQAGINRIGLDWRRFLVALDPEDQVIGIGQVKAHRDGSKELASLVVESKMRGKGIAGRIVTKLLQENPGSLWLVCRSELTVFYSRFGFQLVSDPNQMPPYFKRIARVVEIVSRVRRRSIPLAIMQAGRLGE